VLQEAVRRDWQAQGEFWRLGMDPQLIRVLELAQTNISDITRISYHTSSGVLFNIEARGMFTPSLLPTSFKSMSLPLSTTNGGTPIKPTSPK
jgi:hypothetical protein